MRKRAHDLTGLPLLRIYWYDGTDGPPTSKHVALAYQPDVKLRLGLVNRQGAQKGVDSLIVTDLINLSRNRAMASAVLLTGDEDIRVGVLQAQEYGVRVHLVGIGAPPGGEHNQAALLKQEADDVCELSFEEVRAFMDCPAMRAPTVDGGFTPVPPSLPPEPRSVSAAELSEAQMDAVVEEVVNDIGPEAIGQIARTGRASIPSDLDGRLLKAASSRLHGGPVPDKQKKHLRARFVAACGQRASRSNP